MKVYTYNPVEKNRDELAFYVLSKGLNSGRPSMRSNPYFFVVKADTKEERNLLFNYVYILWKADKFGPNLVGSVIPFLRVTDFKKILNDTLKDQTLDHSKIRFVFSFIVTIKRKRDIFEEKIKLLKSLENAYIRNQIKL